MVIQILSHPGSLIDPLNEAVVISEILLLLDDGIQLTIVFEFT